MAIRHRAWMSWSSGKDSTMALAVARDNPDVDVAKLMVTMNADADRVAMHAVRRELVEAQADRLGLPLVAIELPYGCSNELYEAKMAGAIDTARGEGVDTFVFGDLFLEDVRRYREEQLSSSGISAMFPLWGEPTGRLAASVVTGGVAAIITCVDPNKMPASLAGRLYDDRFLAALPAGVDPCGEGGEFHTFVFDAPAFSSPIDVRVGGVVERDGFVFCDVRAV